MKNSIKTFIAVLIALGLYSCKDSKSQSQHSNAESTERIEKMNTIFVGTYTKKEGHVDGKADGIYSLYQNPETGDLKKGKTVAKVVNPSFIKVSKDNKFLFAVSELGPGDGASGFVHSFKINENDSLEEISKISTESFAPAHVAIDQSGNYVFVANYMGGVVMMYKVNPDGSLSKQQRVDLENPEESHAHSVAISANNDKAYIADLGNDKIWIFDFDESKGTLDPSEQAFVSLPDKAGPRHFILSKNGKFAYSINELNSSVSVFKVGANGGLEVLQHISSLPEGFSGINWAADIHLHPSGKFLYASNRGHNSIVSYRVEPSSGKLALEGHTPTLGKTPRNFAISPKGDYLYVANQDSGNISSFIIKADGSLDQNGETLEAKTPVSLEFFD